MSRRERKRLVRYVATCGVHVIIVFGVVFTTFTDPKWDDWAGARLLLLSIPVIFATVVFVPLFFPDVRWHILKMDDNKE